MYNIFLDLTYNIYFLFEKQAFNGLLKVIGIQILFVILLVINKIIYNRKTFKEFEGLKSEVEKLLFLPGAPPPSPPTP